MKKSIVKRKKRKNKIVVDESYAKRKAYKLLELWNRPEYKNEELTLLVSFYNNTSKDLFSKIVEQYAKLKHYIQNYNVVVFESDRSFVSDFVRAWNGKSNSFLRSYRGTLNNVNFLEPDGYVKKLDLKSKKRKRKTIKNYDFWNLELVGAYKARNFSSGRGIRVGVIDTGIDYEHPELSKRVGKNKGINIIEGNTDILDDNGHGTHVAGIISGETTGVSEAELYGIKVLDYLGRGSISDIIAGVDWSISKKLDIINLSLGSPEYNFHLEEIINVAVKNGMYVVAAAGNEGRGYSYPASYDSVISVTAIDKDKKHASFSNINDANDIAAPGVDVLSTYRQGYKELSGTSMASPHVAGGLALLLDYSRREDYRDLIKDFAEKLSYRGRDDYEDVFGAGLLRIDNVVENTSKNNYSRMFKKLLKVIW